MSNPRTRPLNWNHLRKLAERHFGVERFRPGQRPLIRAALQGRDALGILPTGAGKSLCFQLPAQVLPHLTVVVSPLLALIEDQTHKLDLAGVLAARLDSTLSASAERAATSRIAAGDSIVYVTPERLEKQEAVSLLKKAGVSLLVVDEAHCVSQWGHDFRPSYLALRDVAKALGRPPILALTATATPDLEAEIASQLGLRRPEVVREGLERGNLFFEVRRTPSEEAKRVALIESLRAERGSVIVYAATVAACEELDAWLRDHDIDSTRYHGKLPAKERSANQSAFMTGDKRVVVATNAFGLGIDKPDVRLVVHYNFPDSLESYYQEAGRAGRDGQPARALLLYRLEDRRVQSYFLGGKYPKRPQLLSTYEALSRRASGESVVSDIAEETGLSARRIKVIVAELEAMGVLRRQAARLRLVRRFSGPSELNAFATSYESRFDDDRDKLDQIMHYAQSTACRVRQIADYFGEHHEVDCGHCDNCRDGAAAPVAPFEPRAAAPAGYEVASWKASLAARAEPSILGPELALVR